MSVQAPRVQLRWRRPCRRRPRRLPGVGRLQAASPARETPKRQPLLSSPSMNSSSCFGTSPAARCSRNRSGSNGPRFDMRFLGGVSIRCNVAERVEGFPTQASRIFNPGFVRPRVTARGACFEQHTFARDLRSHRQFVEFGLIFGLNTKMTQSGIGARGDCKIHARILEHPLRIVGLLFALAVAPNSVE